MEAGQRAQQRRERWAALQAAELRLQQLPAAAGRVHAELLRGVLEIAHSYSREGQSLSVAPQIGLLLRCSGAKADRLLTEASVLCELPDGLAALESGLLTTEQSGVTARELGRVPDLPTRLTVWRRLLRQLRLDLESGAVLVPPRLRELIRRWVLELAAADAAEEREAAAAERRVEVRRRDDGLADVLLLGVEAGLAQAVLDRVREHSEPVTVFDERTAAQRQLDAAVDLLLGRVGRPSCAGGSRAEDDPQPDGRPQSSGSPTGAACGCLPGTPVPCGAQLLVHVPLGAALGTTAEVAVLSGHGPVEPDVLQQLLLNAPQLRAVFVDEAGVPVSVSDRTRRPERRDPQALRTALLTLAAEEPPPTQPRHPEDHRQDRRREDGEDAAGTPTDAAAAPSPPTTPRAPLKRHPSESAAATAAEAVGEPAAAPGGHPPDAPGPYRPPRWLRRLVEARAPLCEFPGCGVRAVACDAEHDVAWPTGATCACQLGPCCRRHHRAKQEGWTKTRGEHSAVRWTSPTGRTWTSPAQHPAPAPSIRPLRPVPGPNWWDELDPVSLERELWWLDGCPDDAASLELRATDPLTTDVLRRSGSRSSTAPATAETASDPDW